MNKDQAMNAFRESFVDFAWTHYDDLKENGSFHLMTEVFDDAVKLRIDIIPRTLPPHDVD